jgi:hypothetical protein
MPFKVNILNNNDLNNGDYCLISYQPLNDSDIFNPILELACKHRFYYKNILMSYKINNKNTSKRLCPYCMQYGGYLPNIDNEYIKDIHTKLIENKCSAIIKTGKNKGQACKNKANNSLVLENKYYCMKHSNILKK